MIDDGTIKVEEVMRRIDILHEKIKYKAFGKTKPKTEKSRLGQEQKSAQGMEMQRQVMSAEEQSASWMEAEDLKAKELQKRQSEMLESEINEIKMMKHGRMTKVFKMREKIAGSKKQSQEVHAVKNKKGDLIVSNEEIKKVSLEHCLDTFKNKEPHEDAKRLVELKEAVHESRMRAEYEDDFEIDKDDFNEVLDRFKKKNKKSYDLITKSSESFLNSVF